MKVLFYLSFLFAISFPLASACRCIPKTLKESFFSTSTELVFRAKVSFVFSPCQPCTVENQNQKRMFLLKIEQVYKGCPSTLSNFPVQSFIGGSLCGISLTKDTVYLFNIAGGIFPNINSCNVCSFLHRFYTSAVIFCSLY